MVNGCLLIFTTVFGMLYLYQYVYTQIIIYCQLTAILMYVFFNMETD